MTYFWRGAGYGPEANLEVTAVYTVRKGKVLYQEFFWDHAEALEPGPLGRMKVKSPSRRFASLLRKSRLVRVTTS